MQNKNQIFMINEDFVQELVKIFLLILASPSKHYNKRFWVLNYPLDYVIVLMEIMQLVERWVEGGILKYSSSGKSK